MRRTPSPIKLLLNYVLKQIPEARVVRALYKIGFWIPLAGCTYLALIPNPEDFVGSWSDTVLHIAAFAYLTGAVALAHFDFQRAADGAVTQGWWWPSVCMVSYGSALEIAQSLIQERNGELRDLAMDGVGIGLGYLGYLVYSRLRAALPLRG